MQLRFEAVVFRDEELVGLGLRDDRLRLWLQ
jgi:hypothetical protein